MRLQLGIAIATGALLLAGCAAAPEATAPEATAPDAIGASPWALQSQWQRQGAWKHHPFPGKKPTRFNYARKDGRDAMAVQAESSASMLRHSVRIAPEDLGNVRFSWKVPALIEQADLASRDKADSTVRIVLAFEGDRSRFSPRDAAMSELARALTGEDMPYATLMYVWCNKRPAGTVIRSTRTDRIRKLVVQSGASGLNRWLDYERDIRADYERAFGEKPGALVGIGIMTDSDNTRTRAQAWYGPVTLHSTTAPAN
jgi:hypothetical protein